MLLLLGYLSTTRGRPAIFIATYTYIVFMQEHCFIFKLNSVSSTVAILRFIVSIVLNDYRWTVLTVFIGHWEHTTTIRGQKIYNQLAFSLGDRKWPTLWAQSPSIFLENIGKRKDVVASLQNRPFMSQVELFAAVKIKQREKNVVLVASSLLIIINGQVQAMRETGISAIAFTLPAAEPWVDR